MYNWSLKLVPRPFKRSFPVYAIFRSIRRGKPQMIDSLNKITLISKKIRWKSDFCHFLKIVLSWKS